MCRAVWRSMTKLEARYTAIMLEILNFTLSMDKLRDQILACH